MGIVQGPGVGINKTEKCLYGVDMRIYVRGSKCYEWKGEGVLNVFGPVMTKVGKVIGM